MSITLCLSTNNITPQAHFENTDDLKFSNSASHYGALQHYEHTLQQSMDHSKIANTVQQPMKTANCPLQHGLLPSFMRHSNGQKQERKTM